jgi:hypothetical protein
LARQAAAAVRPDVLSRLDAMFPGKSVYDLLNAQIGLAGKSPFESFKEMELARRNGIESWALAEPLTPNYARLLPPGPRDPEKFYYDWPPDVLVTKGGLTCELWRHHSDPEIFDFEVVFIGNGTARGAVECTVHAENLTQPARGAAKVVRTVEPASMVDLANTLVEACG